MAKDPVCGMNVDENRAAGKAAYQGRTFYKPRAGTKCGMPLEPEVPTTPAARTEYTCPLHPEIVRPGVS